MALKYKIHNASTTHAIEQAARVGSNMVIVHSIGPCSHLKFNPDPITGRYMDEFPQYFDNYPKVAELRHSADSVWLEPLRREIRSLCERTVALNMKPVFHFYEPQLPLVFEREYPDLVGIWKRTTQEGTQDVHTKLDPDNPETWELMQSKYFELARDFPEVALFVITTGDIAGTYWGIPEAEMSIVDRLANQFSYAQKGLDEAGTGAKVCFRLWWRNNPDRFFFDGARMIGELTGLDNAIDLMNPIMKPYNHPPDVLPAVFEKLPEGAPIMFKSTPMDIHENTPLTKGAGAYPEKLDQIIEISYERYNEKPWPWCKVRHIRQGLDAVKEHNLNGYVSLPINMGNNQRELDPETGNLGRMNTWMFEKLASGDKRTDRELVADWLEEEFGSPQPEVAVDVLIEAEVLADDGLQWGNGVHNRITFGSLHTTKLYWISEGFMFEDFVDKISNPDEEFIEYLINMKHDAYEKAHNNLLRIQAAQGGLHPDLFKELEEGYSKFADVILLQRDWNSYLLMQYAIEKKVYPAERKVLGRMSRYTETFIRNLVRLKDTPAGEHVMSRIAFPDNFPLS